MSDLPIFFSELQPPDALGRCTQRLWLGEEYLGEFHQTIKISAHGLTKGEPLMSAYRAVWEGEGFDYSKRWLRITLADGRELLARAGALTLAAGEWPRRAAKPKREKERAKPVQPPEAQGKLRW